jgi:hypothetical protein
MRLTELDEQDRLAKYYKSKVAVETVVERSANTGQTFVQNISQSSEAGPTRDALPSMSCIYLP